METYHNKKCSDELNGGGDPKYAIKLQFVYTLLTKTEYYENAKNNNYSTADILSTKGLAFDISMSKECSGVDELNLLIVLKTHLL